MFPVCEFPVCKINPGAILDESGLDILGRRAFEKSYLLKIVRGDRDIVWVQDGKCLSTCDFEEADLISLRMEMAQHEVVTRHPRLQHYHRHAGIIIQPVLAGNPKLCRWYRLPCDSSPHVRDVVITQGNDDINIIVSSLVEDKRLLSKKLEGALDEKHGLEEARKAAVEAAMRDPLTRAYNRAYVYQQLEAMSLTAQRNSYGEEPLCGVFLLDVDYFKRLNDTHGHPVGDRALVTLADCLQTSSRPGDVVARWGGEEFLIIAPGMKGNEGRDYAERLRCAAARLSVDGGSEKLVSFTVSIGGLIDVLGPCYEGKGLRDSFDHMINIADEQLYNSKHDGRNRVSFCDLTADPASRPALRRNSVVGCPSPGETA